MTEEDKIKRLERIAFNKRWGKLRKLCADAKDVKSTVGKAPRCNVKVKQEKPVEFVNQKKKKK